MSRFRKIVEDAISDRRDFMHSMDMFDIYFEKLNGQLDLDKYYFESDLDLGVELTDENDKVSVVITFKQDENERHAAGLYHPFSSTIELILTHIFADLRDRVDIKYGEDPIMLSKEMCIRGSDILKLVRSNLLRGTFIHEYQHFMDDKKKKYLTKSVDKARKDKSKTTQFSKEYTPDYYNSDHEKNAHYMSMLFSITADIVNQSKTKMASLTPEQRLEFFKDQVNRQDSPFKEYYALLNKNSQRRLLNRVYSYLTADFWKDLK